MGRVNQGEWLKGCVTAAQVSQNIIVGRDERVQSFVHFNDFVPAKAIG